MILFPLLRSPILTKDNRPMELELYPRPERTPKHFLRNLRSPVRRNHPLVPLPLRVPDHLPEQLPNCPRLEASGQRAPSKQKETGHQENLHFPQEEAEESARRLEQPQKPKEKVFLGEPAGPPVDFGNGEGPADLGGG